MGREIGLGLFYISHSTHYPLENKAMSLFLFLLVRLQIMTFECHWQQDAFFDLFYFILFHSYCSHPLDWWSYFMYSKEGPSISMYWAYEMTAESSQSPIEPDIIFSQVRHCCIEAIWKRQVKVDMLYWSYPEKSSWTYLTWSSQTLLVESVLSLLEEVLLFDI